MRMPIFSYFLVVGAVLTGLLIWLGDDGDLQSAPMRTSQQVGMPKPFKGKPETMVDITNANFAAAHERPATEPNRAQEKPRRSPPNRSRGTSRRRWRRPGSRLAAQLGASGVTRSPLIRTTT